MNTQQITYLSIGTNEGNRIKNLQNSIDQINYNIGTVTQISSIYKTPSWGFIGNDFYNICIKVTTLLNPTELLSCLLEIEKNIGRKEKTKKEYQNRVIDIDILLFNKDIITSKSLTIPHLKMLDRKFVLVPLIEIAPNKNHPIKNETFIKCLKNCSDTSEIVKINKQLKKPISLKDKYNYIVIEGNIGVGKTSLATMISEELGAVKLFEQFVDNPFLSKFYEDKERYAFQLETSFLMDRYKQLNEILNSKNTKNKLIIADYSKIKSLIFSRINLSKEEYILYKKMIHLVYKNIREPDLYVYLYQKNEVLLKNIKQRGRSYEQNIKTTYLSKIQQGYQEIINNQTTEKTLYIDISKLDFVKKNTDYRYIINKIKLF